MARFTSEPGDENECEVCYIHRKTAGDVCFFVGTNDTYPMNCCTVIFMPNFAHARRQLVQCWLIVSMSVPSQSSTRPFAPSGNNSGGMIVVILLGAASPKCARC